MMKKLHFEKAAAEAAISARRVYVDRINELGDQLKRENITLSNEILAGFLSGGTEYIGRLLIEESVRQYNQAGIHVNSVLMANLGGSAQAVSAEFDKYYLPIHYAQRSTGIGPDLVNITDEGVAVFTDTELKEIEERYTTRLRKEDETIFNKLGELAKILNQTALELREAGEESLIECLKIATTQNSKIIDEKMKLQLRTDTYFILNSEGEVEVNPAYFNR